MWMNSVFSGGPEQCQEQAVGKALEPRGDVVFREALPPLLV